MGEMSTKVQEGRLSGTIMTFCDAKTGALRRKEGGWGGNGSTRKEEGLREDDWIE